MKTIQTICDIPNATAIDLGPLSELKDYELVILCVQYVAAAPGAVNPSDGTILNEPVKW